MNFTWKCPPYIDNKDLQTHEKLLEALQLHPEDAVLLHGFILHATYAKDAAKCIESADFLIAHAKDNMHLFWAHYLKANTLEGMKDYQGALASYLNALPYDDSNGDGMQAVLADVYAELHKYDEALECYFRQEALLIKAAQEDGEQFEEYYLYDSIAEVYFKKMEYDKAITYFEKSYTANSESTVAICGKGRALAMQGRHDEAMACFKEAFEIDPMDEYIYYYIGHVWQNKGDFYRAMHNYTEALKIKPDMPEVYNNIAGLMLHEEGDFKAAINNMVEALEHAKPGNKFLPLLYQNMARLHHRIADYEMADYYTMKMMEALGFPVDLKGSEGDEDDGELNE